jgi:hypothetical protein
MGSFVSCKVTDTHGHRLKYYEIKNNRKRNKMMRNKGYPTNIMKHQKYKTR